MSYSNYNLPSTGSNYSYTASYSTSSPQKVSTQTYTSDSFTKPASNYGLTTSFSNTGLPATSYTSYSLGGSAPSTYTTTSYGNTSLSQTFPSASANTYTTTGYGNTSYSQVFPSASTNTYATSYATPSASYTTPSTNTYSTSLSASQTYPSTYNYSTSVAAPSTTTYGGSTSYGVASSSVGGYGGSYSVQQPSVAKPSVSSPIQPTSYSSNVSYNPPAVTSTASASVSVSQSGDASTTADTSKFEATMRQLKSSGQKFTDSEFPINDIKTLTDGQSEEELAAGGSPLDWSRLIWLRLDEIYGKGNYQIFQEKIEPDDVKQGSLGDCYFLCTLAAIAEKPERIKRLFVTDTPNEQGLYGVRVCDGGIWQTIMLDDYIPCSGKSKKPCFTTGNGNEVWVQLLEKAWAKVYGSYARIEAGLTSECLHDFTGAPTKTFKTNDQSKHEEIWKWIITGEKRNYIMTAGADDFFEDGADRMDETGLVGSHAYSLLSAAEVTDKYGKQVRLVKLRNPWGQGEWLGDWCDDSPLWTPELKRQLGIEEKDDGDFWMSFSDLLKYFSDVEVCKIHDDFKYKAVKANCNSKNGVYFKMNVTVPGHYYVTVNQESRRKHAPSEDYQYSDVFLVMGKKVGDRYQYVEGIYGYTKEIWTDGHLDAGEYVIYSKIAWNNRRPKDFVLSCYGKGDVDLQIVDKRYVGDFIEKVYMDKGSKSDKFEDYQHCGVPACKRAIEMTDDGFGYIYYKNGSNKTLEEEVTYTVLDGLKLKKPYNGRGYKISVPPGQEKIIVMKTIPGTDQVRKAFRESARFV